MSNTASTLSQRYCKFANVTFPSAVDDGVYRVSVKTDKAQTSAVIWLESKKTKLQWACVIEGMAELMTTEDFVLPSIAVLHAIKDGLAAIVGPNTPEAKLSSSSIVDLTMKKDTLALDLAIHLSPVWTATYRFEMTPIEVKLVDILEARIRDLEEANARPRVAFCTLTTTTEIGGSLCEWTAPSPHEAAALVHLEGGTSNVTVLQAGLYHIHCTFTTETGEITLYVDEADAGTAPYTCYKPNEDEASWYYQADVTHVAQLAAGARIELDGGLYETTIPGSMTILKLQQGAF
ncbi:hypothetical protein SPRG_03262 [Saprolegnia parasitica CBS 223.65]|uniref:Uncharacterized protein n=1 Tax=Saprolegnia parasitica (strain CBS 223.65) TaxID=695850 RepID=A0A067CMX3_SAPPC|nr:hypothetical protein SPRG_03262 [Saprolegnia parasitica CBS 223.65]KDO32044.1 hypothetical protein SPRG_03262 [Saprolegnia parasitica CBS 223.65]|eukprot:XP_012197232.1 hypothetical protein SPRG_03262 [Saprolegnia parasitica CBS 223.65]